MVESDTIEVTVTSAIDNGSVEIVFNVPPEEILSVEVFPTHWFRVDVQPESDLDDASGVELENPNPVEQDAIVQVVSKNGVDDPHIRHDA